MKLSKRLQAIADLVSTSSVIDVGCDHGLLDVYLAKEKQISCIASDISENALKQAQNNIEKYQVQTLVKTICTNGLDGIPVSENDTVVLSGMGTHTIIDILKDRHDVKHCIISAHTDIPSLRKWMVSQGYAIFEETVIDEKNILYIIISFEKKEVTYQEIDYEIGPILKQNISYLERRMKEEQQLLQQIPKKHEMKRKETEHKIQLLQEAIKKAI